VRPGSWVTIVFILSFGTGVYFDSAQSLGAMGFLRFMVVFVFIGDDVGCRRRQRLQVVHEVSKGIVCNFYFVRELRVVWLWQASPYFYTCLYAFACMLVFLT
jgi:hypothetical protein